ncbi:hypothetical protein HELRODRAFT_188320 [Helobdella robusta]|uniref:LsmAD domain-containing protein n=1 Tax=Helobdella robusta TaxID=6412 RepID=T1FPV4_HELRO|nr:hypothetical protein HELRODRAFT_188320 [Helobdella robusta]ESO06299.1 hypothetical protein HELRODRAFT_188320 [Helobdella robusta]
MSTNNNNNTYRRTRMQNNRNNNYGPQNSKPRRMPDSFHHPVNNNSGPDLNVGVYKNERFIFQMTNLVGVVARITNKQAETFEGIFKTLSHKLEVMLDKVHKVDKSNPSWQPCRSDIQPCMVFKPEEIVNLQFLNADPNYAIIGDNFTDGAISRKSNGQVMEKELQPWVSDSHPDDDDDLLESSNTNGWDPNEMFRTNQDKFQIMTTYDPNLTQYTTPMPSHNTEEFQQHVEKAAALAREIESSASYKHRMELENTKDEETLHSAVVREENNSSNTSSSLQQKSQTSTASSVSTPSSLLSNRLMKTSLSGNYSDIVSNPKPANAVVNNIHHTPQQPQQQQPQQPQQQQQQQQISAVQQQQQHQPLQHPHQQLHHHQQPQSHSSRTEIDEFKDFKENFNMQINMSASVSSPPSSMVNNISNVPSQMPVSNNNNNTHAAMVPSTPSSTSIAVTTAVANNTVNGATTSSTLPNSTNATLTQPVGSKSNDESNSEGTSENTEKRNYTLNPNANEFKPRVSSLDTLIIQQQHTPQLQPPVNNNQLQHQQHLQQQLLHTQQQQSKLVQQQQQQQHQQQLQQLVTQQPQMVPPTVGSPPVLYTASGVPSILATQPPQPQFVYTQKYPASAKRATVSARVTNELATPQSANVMAGAPLISQSGVPQMFITPTGLAPYNSVRLMLPGPIFYDPNAVGPNHMFLPAQMIPQLPQLAGGPATAVVSNIHPHLIAQQQSQQQQQQQQPNNNNNGGGNGCPDNGSGAPTPVHYLGPPPQLPSQQHMQQQQHQQQQQQQQQNSHQHYPVTPSTSLAFQPHHQVTIGQPGAGHLQSTTHQSQVIISPFLPNFQNAHHHQAGGYAATMPPTTPGAGALQGQVPPGSTIHPHSLVHPHSMFIAAPNQQGATPAQLGQFVAVNSLGPPNMTAPHPQPLLYNIQQIPQSMHGPSYQHGQG